MIYAFRGASDSGASGALVLIESDDHETARETLAANGYRLEPSDSGDFEAMGTVMVIKASASDLIGPYPVAPYVSESR